MVKLFALRAKIIGTPNFCAAYKAGAIPDASIVITLVMPASAKTSAKRLPIASINSGSTWCVIKLSTFKTPSPNTRPSFLIRSTNSFTI